MQIDNEEVPEAQVGSGAYVLIIDVPNDAPEVVLFDSEEAAHAEALSIILDKDAGRGGKCPLEMILGDDPEALLAYVLCETNGDRIEIYHRGLWDRCAGDFVEFRVEAKKVQDGARTS